MENGGSGIVPDGAKSNIKKSKPNAFFKNRKSNIGKSSYVEEDKHRQGKRVKREFFDEGYEYETRKERRNYVAEHDKQRSYDGRKGHDRVKRNKEKSDRDKGDGDARRQRSNNTQFIEIINIVIFLIQIIFFPLPNIRHIFLIYSRTLLDFIPAFGVYD